MADKQFKEAVLYICRMRFGYIDDLQNKIDKVNVQLLKDAGFLSCGKGYKNEGEKIMRNTWKVTEMARNYCKTMYGGIFVSM